MDATNERGRARPTRRTLARGAAWAVPVVAVGAAAPAMAASGGTGGISARCASATSTSGTFSVSVTGSLVTQLQVAFRRASGSGTFSITPESTWVLVPGTPGAYTYLIPVVGGTATGTATMSSSGISNNGTQTVTGELSAPGGQVITGTTSASITITRQGGGSSSNYTCSAA